VSGVATTVDHITPDRVWRGRDFRVAWSAGFVNDTGDWVLAVALPVFVFVETDSGTATAILFVCQLVAGGVLGPFAGSLVDRWNLRRCLVATNLAQAAALLPLLAVDRQRIWPAYVAMAAQSALAQLNNPANVALLPRVVRPEQLTGANAALAASASIARLIGAPLGGVLVAWGGLRAVVVVDAASFLAVAATLAFLRADTEPRPPEMDDPRPSGVRAGLQAVRQHPPLGRLIALQGAAAPAQGAFVVLFVVFVVDAVGDDGSRLGLIRGMMGVGALLGSAAVGRVAGVVEPTVLFALGLLGMGAVSLVFWNAPSFASALWIYVALFACSGIPAAALTVGGLTTIQRHSPGDAIGRVVGLMGSLETVGVAAGSLVAGALVDHVPLRLLLNAQSAIYLATGVLAWRLVVPSRRGSRSSADAA
jgi:predicted MFS family arabinose efflux permease